MMGLCLACGAPMFWVGALFVSKGSLGNVVTEIGALLFGVGIVFLGATLLAKPQLFAMDKALLESSS